MRRRTLIRDRETALDVAVDAYVYLYPLVLLDFTRRLMTTCEGVGHAPANRFAHVARPLPASFRDVVRPSFDTYQSFAWLDVAREPVIVSVPDAGDCHYLLAMIDMWTDLVAAPGTRTSGNWPAVYAVAAPGWEGDLPEGARRIEAPTPDVWMLGHFQPDGGGESLQSQLRIVPLSRWRRDRECRLRLHYGRLPVPSLGSPGPPVQQVDAMTASEFFVRGIELLGRNRPHVNDHAVLERMERIGLVAGEPLDVRALPPAVACVLVQAVAHGRFELDRRARCLGTGQNGWRVCSGTMGAWGTNYLKRAAVARRFLGTVMPEDVVQAAAFVDEADRPLEGAHRYTLRFAPHDRPPVDAFWSLTAYDEQGYAVPNGCGRYALASQDGLEASGDGSLELAIQHSPPVDSPAANWLPCPAGPFNLCLRLYRPERRALDGSWAPPAIRRLHDAGSAASGLRATTPAAV